MKKLLLFTVFLVTSFLSSAQEAKSIFNDISASGIKATISRAEVKEIFFGNVKMYEGMRLKVFVLPKQHLTTILFCQDVLGINSHQFFEKINDKANAGYANYASIVENEITMIQKIANTIGSIGYINTSTVAKNTKDYGFVFLTITD